MTVFEIVSGKRHLHHVQTSKEDVIDLDNRNELEKCDDLR